MNTAAGEAQDVAYDEYDVAIMGAGFSGLYQLQRLRQLGLRVRLFEAAGAVGGTWHWNCYPGARVDTPSNIYQYSDENLWREWSFFDLYPSYKEIREYFDFVDEKWSLSKDISFNTRITHAEFDQANHCWILSTNGKPAGRARFFVTCTGFASRPYIPAVPGLQNFKGKMHHTARWPQEGLDLRGKRVGVLGTGASGIQVIQEVGKTAAHVTVFQRTPNTTLPMRQKRFDDEGMRKFKQEFPTRFELRGITPSGFDMDVQHKRGTDATEEERREVFEKLWDLGGFHFWLANFDDLVENEQTNRSAYMFWRDKVRARISDPEMAEILAPTEPLHPFGVKRPCLEQNFYEIMNGPNITLVDLRASPIERVTSSSVVISDREYELDVLVLATGFDSITGGLTAIDIRGTDGQTFAEKWANGVRTHLGMASAEFPNLFFVFGPQGPSGFANGPTCAELQGNWVIDCIEFMVKNKLTRIEARQDAQDGWTDHLDELFHKSLFPRAESWYNGANIPGKTRQILGYPGGFSTYLEKCADSARNGYEGFALS
jgi:cation diffusion facilitator CzcD-associated flavoprotein CzcO